MHKDALPKNAPWRFVRSLLVGVVLMFLLVVLRKELSIGGTLFFIGFLIVFFLTTLTDRDLFYYGGTRPQGPDDKSS